MVIWVYLGLVSIDSSLSPPHCGSGSHSPQLVTRTRPSPTSADSSTLHRSRNTRAHPCSSQVESFTLHHIRPLLFNGDSNHFGNMDRMRRFLTDRVAYEPLDDSAEADADEHVLDVHGLESHLPRFSRLEYSVFFLLGVSMLWAW